ncbi:hypothetical protein ACQEVF_05375 [Nonomuraea polychroma]|uniref:hypothetical protein n=1 Tax=Nonomuraea polychroma TaxID=46176 RepID=UPI003D8F6F5E
MTALSDDSGFDGLDPRVAHAQRAYNRATLAIYDRLVLGLGCSLFWRCPAGEMLRLYDRSAGRRHLDIGPGTGYFVDRCRFPTATPKITLLDLSQPCLDKSAKRLVRYRPDTCSTSLTPCGPVACCSAPRCSPKGCR